MSLSKVEDPNKVAAAAVVQQSDNVAHALAGAGGGVLSMILTCAYIYPLAFQTCHSSVHALTLVSL
jgi:hypothetical protein